MVVYVASADDPAPLLGEGCWEGHIIPGRRGSNGFGYDPSFVPAGDTRTVAEISEDDLRLNCLRKAFQQLHADAATEPKLRAAAGLFRNLTAGIDVKKRWEHAHKLLSDHAHAVSDVWSWHDPAPALGVLYPLAVFLKHGRVSTELLVS